MDVKVKFWGVRGSIPTPGEQTIRYGGNTSCVSINCGDDLIIFDGGSGIRLLGNELLKQGKPVRAHLFFTHFHWDHIQGFPFFTPAFLKGNEFHIYGETKMESNLQETLAGQMAQPNFPVALKDMESTLVFNHVTAGDEIALSKDIKVRAGKLNHPGGATSYRFESNNKIVLYATDTEHEEGKIDENLVSQAQDASVFIYDTTYTTDEYYGKNGKMSKVGWGHSTPLEGIKIAKQANAKTLYLFHHDPVHNDNDVRKIEEDTKKEFKNVVAAYEGLEVII